MNKKIPMTVRTRLTLGFGAILALMLVVAATGVLRLASLNDQLTLIANDREPKIVVATDWLFRVMESARHTRNMLILDEPDKIKAEIAAVMDDKKARQDFMEKLQASVVTVAGKASLQEVIDARSAYGPSEDEYLKLVEKGDRAVAKAHLLEKLRPLQLVYITKLRSFIDSQKVLIQQSQQSSAESYASSRLVLICASLLGLMAGALAAWLIIRSMLAQLGGEPAYAAQVADRIAEGDLSVSIAIRQGDTASMLHAIARMRDNLASIVHDVRLGTDTIATASS
ncbi:MAG: MCP four helix bundle domain-containing protein, partial [Telluria sp.]